MPWPFLNNENYRELSTFKIRGRRNSCKATCNMLGNTFYVPPNKASL